MTTKAFKSVNQEVMKEQSYVDFDTVNSFEGIVFSHHESIDRGQRRLNSPTPPFLTLSPP